MKIVIIGAGQAGASLAARLRNLGFSGSLTLVGDEPDLPYERPPLSKAYLLGKLPRERLYLRPKEFYRTNEIDVRTGTRVGGIDLAERLILLGDTKLNYDELVLTTGSSPRRLPTAIGGDLAGVHVIRTICDVDRLSSSCRPGARALVVGGGYIGLEAAAVFRSLGMEVLVIEVAERILQRVTAPETSKFVAALHTRHGVEIRVSTGLKELVGDDRVTAAVLSDGTRCPIDLVVVGIGGEPNDQLARDAGIKTDGGVLVDEKGHTSAAHVWAAGDCAKLPFGDALIRLESVQNAVAQSSAVAENLMGQGSPYRPVPWFWSDQYDMKLQIAGLNAGFDRVVVRLGQSGATSHWYFAGSKFLAVDAMNDPRSFMLARRVLETGQVLDPCQIADQSVDLKSLLI